MLAAAGAPKPGGQEKIKERIIKVSNEFLNLDLYPLSQFCEIDLMLDSSCLNCPFFLNCYSSLAVLSGAAAVSCLFSKNVGGSLLYFICGSGSR